MIIGTSYSHRHIKDIGIDSGLALNELIDFGFDIVRLGCYWDEIEAVRGVYDFSEIKKILDACEKEQQAVLLTVGMKSPRWPEYYLPLWVGHNRVYELEHEVLEFITSCVNELKKYSCISHWQVENESMDPSGPEHLCISKELLKKEVETVKKLDNRPVVINFWGNELSKRKLLGNVVDFADIVGLDIYYKVPLAGFGYWKPNDSDRKLKKIIDAYPLPVWITELQAEPWEHNEVFSITANPKSINPELMKDNFERALTLGVDAIMLWGFEYWLWKRLQGNSDMWDSAKEILNSNR